MQSTKAAKWNKIQISPQVNWIAYRFSAPTVSNEVMILKVLMKEGDQILYLDLNSGRVRVHKANFTNRVDIKSLDRALTPYLKGVHIGLMDDYDNNSDLYIKAFAYEILTDKL